MLSINDDCLAEVFLKLPVRDLIVAMKVCTKFRDVIVDRIFKHTLKTGLELKDVSHKEFEELMILLKPTLKCLIIGRPWTFKSSHYASIYDRDISMFYQYTFENLVEFECHYEILDDNDMLMFATICPQLRKLTVSSVFVTGEHIIKMRCLEELTLQYVTLGVTHLDLILRQLKLKYLDLSCIRCYSHESMFATTTPVPSLKNLKVLVPMFMIVVLGKLTPNLEHLEIYYTSWGHSKSSYREIQEMIQVTFGWINVDEMLRRIKSVAWRQFYHNLKDPKRFANMIRNFLIKCPKMISLQMGFLYEHNFKYLDELMHELPLLKRKLKLIFNASYKQKTQLKVWQRTSGYYPQSWLIIDPNGNEISADIEIEFWSNFEEEKEE